MKKIISVLLLTVIFASIIGCGQSESQAERLDLAFDDQIESYDSNLFYVNELPSEDDNPQKLLGAADPTIVYVEKGEYAGWFFMYCTSTTNTGYRCWKSKDLHSWEYVSEALRITDKTQNWGQHSYWAPGVIYDPSDENYYMFYSAYSNKFGRLSGGIAVSSSPAGPFVNLSGEVQAGVYANGQAYEGYTVTTADPIFDFEKLKDIVNGSYEYTENGPIKVIDLEPFIDPVTGKKYVYFCRDLGDGNYTRSAIMGMEMIDWLTPDYSTLKLLTLCGYYTPEFSQEKTPEGDVNEGAYMTYHDGKYYLTYSCFGFQDKMYQVRQAIADGPLGDFVKVPLSDGGQVIACEPDWDFLSGTGHHTFVEYGGELYIVYHEHVNRKDGSGNRAIGFDKCVFIENNKGQTIIHANGPTYSVQPQLKEVSGYKNVAQTAKVSVSGAKSSVSASCLNDGVIGIRENDNSKVFRSESSKTIKITLEFPQKIDVKSILIYNDYLYDYSFDKIDKIELYGTCQKEDGSVFDGIGVLNNLLFDTAKYVSKLNEYENLVHPASAAIAVLDKEFSTNKIVITVSPKQYASGIGLTEIAVLAKN